MSEKDERVTDITYQVKDMPVSVNELLNKICTVRSIKKWELVREALIEYAENHRKELVEWAQKG